MSMSKIVGPEGLLGPDYSYADELKTPTELGINRGGSFTQIMRAVGGVNYYADAIGFGKSTGLAKSQNMLQKPLGLRYFIKTGAKCSNGEDMYEYVDTMPPGLKGRVGEEIQKTLGVEFRGLAPGIVSDAVEALNPMPMYNSVTGTGYARCKLESKTVGDADGALKSQLHPNTDNVWVSGNPGKQSKWIFKEFITMDQYDKEFPASKLPAAPSIAQMLKGEGFVGNSVQVLPPTIAAGILFAALFLGMAMYARDK